MPRHLTHYVIVDSMTIHRGIYLRAPLANTSGAAKMPGEQEAATHIHKHRRGQRASCQKTSRTPTIQALMSISPSRRR